MSKHLFVAITDDCLYIDIINLQFVLYAFNIFWNSLKQRDGTNKITIGEFLFSESERLDL